ncbi:MAG: hypothetical protein ABIQ77_11620, partial [Anaerolineales bacterium]
VRHPTGSPLGLSVLACLVSPRKFAFSYTTKVLFTPRCTILVDWRVGEDTKTGLATFAYGSLVVEPFLDAGIDIYASGYNHGYFCGIPTLAACIGSTIINAFP